VMPAQAEPFQTAPADTIPAPTDTIPAPPDTLPAFPDTIPLEPVTVGEDTIPPVPDPADQEELRIVPTWPELKTPRTNTSETDSTMRWFMALDWAERLSGQLEVSGLVSAAGGARAADAGCDAGRRGSSRRASSGSQSH
jgi:hypothetical protein